LRHAEAEVRAVIHPKRKDDKHYEDLYPHGLLKHKPFGFYVTTEEKNDEQ
jgi:hypothetical protein